VSESTGSRSTDLARAGVGELFSETNCRFALPDSRILWFGDLSLLFWRLKMSTWKFLILLLSSSYSHFTYMGWFLYLWD